MKTKIIKIGAAVPLFALGVLGYASSASAADFSQGGQLNIASALQLEASPGGGGSNVFADILFAPTLPAGFTGAENMDQLVDAANPILQVDDPPANAPGVFDRNAALGDFGEVAVQAGNTGVFDGIVFGDSGTVQNFEANTGGSDIPDFIQVGNFVFSLDISSVETSLDPLGTFQSELQSPDTNAEVSFDAVGTVVDTTMPGTFAPVRFDFTGQFLFDNGDGGDPIPEDFITAIGSVSGSIIVEQPDIDIPEPSSILGMLLLGGGFFSQGLLHKSRKVNS